MTTKASTALPGWFGTARLIDAASVRAATPWTELIAAMRTGFGPEVVVPPRHHHALGAADDDRPVLLMMPAWRRGAQVGVKLVHVAADNRRHGLPNLHSLYVLSDADTGAHLAIIDGGELTVRRTAAVSALAASYLAGRDVSRLLMVGTGRLAPHLVAAHAAVRSYRTIGVWGRDAARAARMVATLEAEHGIAARVEVDFEDAVRRADVVSCATASTAPLIHGDWLAAGAHVDLVGGFTPLMREADDAAVARAELWIDTPVALEEAGDLIAPMSRGVIGPEAIVGTLADLCDGSRNGRRHADAVTLFKSVGSAEADLAAAGLVVARIAGADRAG